MAKPAKLPRDLASEARSQILQVAAPNVPSLRRVRRKFSARLKAAEAAVVLDVARILLASGDVPKWVPFELVHYHRAAMQSLRLATLKQFGAGLAA